MALVLDGTNGVSGVDGTASNPSLEGTDSNTGIFFPAADTVAIGTGGTERLRVDSAGNAGLGVTPSAWSSGYRAIDVQFGAIANTNAGSVDVAITQNAFFNGSNWITKYSGQSKRQVLSDAGFVWHLGASQTAGNAITFTQAMTLDASGDLLVGTTNDNPATGNVNGVAIKPDGFMSQITGEGGPGLGVNRKVNDGDLVRFYQDGTLEGSISVSGNTVSYNPFLGSHAGAFADWSRPEVKIGTIFETINELIDYKVVVIEVEDVPKRISYNGNGAVGTTATVEYEGQEYNGIIENERGQERDFNKHVKVKINDTPDSKAVYGVFVGWNTDPSNDGGVYNDMLIGAVGNYVIRMAAGQTPEIGDLVKADGTGCAIVQEDDIVRTKTVGKITNTIPQLTYEDGSFLVACVLYCG